jgi:peptide/nickel transport system permease protein/oligopeptide transport system permease protein
LSGNQFSPPTLAHPFGTDLNGRDLLYRVLEGARISLLVGISGALISFFVGTAYGLVAGYAGGRTDGGMMRAVEILYAIPRLIIILIFINAFDKHLKDWMANSCLGGLVGDSRVVIIILCLGLIEWLTMARIVRGQVLSLKAQQFVAAAQALGQGHFKILTRHLLPNLLSPPSSSTNPSSASLGSGSSRRNRAGAPSWPTAPRSSTRSAAIGGSWSSLPSRCV